ncbi:MAG TPA: AHH domain-containing protein [Anaeromyxobacter sp.]|nr:AHH domain-containing protein [Anaeromyxobacter sp.]
MNQKRKLPELPLSNVDLPRSAVWKSYPPPFPVMQDQPAPALARAPEAVKEAVCKYCGKPAHAFAEKGGSSIGVSSILERRIFKGSDKRLHPWYTGLRSLQAHHLICSEALDHTDWVLICNLFGYDINHKNNGVMLPNTMALACQLFAPLHRGPHDAGLADGLPYPSRVKQLAEQFKKKALTGAYCDDPRALVDDLDDLSADILAKVDRFVYTLTCDGADYAEGVRGCAGATSVARKLHHVCPAARRHGLKQNGVGPVIQRRRGSLKVGV